MRRTLAKETVAKIGKQVQLAGWVDKRRDHGKIVFLDLRDRSGIVQCVVEPTASAGKFRNEEVVEVVGIVQRRPKRLENYNLATGAVEVKAEKIKILAGSRELPLPVHGDGYQIDEEVRLKYRYLDLRRPRLQRNLKLRSEYVRAAREYLFRHDFVEIETPILTKSTPEGSRDFVVPSRLYPGKFFALPQSPQQYKQLLMVAGFERYFQIARCLRDEDLRADRAYEHTQLDLELSFVTQEEIMRLVEKMTIYALERIGAKIARKPFPIFTYQEAMSKFGADKFDLRSKREKQEQIMSFAWVVDFPFFKKDRAGNWTFTHNPFSQPISAEHTAWLLAQKNLDQILASQYDLVCNGLEVAGGSIRSNKPQVLRSIFAVLGYTKQETEEKFGHLLEAFHYGAPPHGGCAQGFERLLMAYLGEDYLREVQAFPQTGSGRTAVMDAPAKLEEKQLQELNIKVVGNGKKEEQEKNNC